MTQRVALVAGGGRGIGREVALLLSAAGARVMVVSPSVEELSTVLVVGGMCKRSFGRTVRRHVQRGVARLGAYRDGRAVGGRIRGSWRHVVVLRATLLTALLCGAGFLTACGGRAGPAPSDNTLNVYNWAGYIAPDTVANFERETGVEVHYSTYESNEISETKLLMGHSNYDVVTSADAFFERELHAGVFRKLDNAALPNRVNLDPEIMQELGVHDPGNLYAVPYLWTEAGLGYNVDKVRERLGPVEPDSWSLLFDPKNAAKLKDCGIMIVDSPEDVLPSVLIYLGKNPNSRDPADWTAAADVLTRIRPFVRSIEAEGIIGDLANGSLCLGLTWGGEVTQARYRALEENNGVKLRYFVPREGAVAGLDMLVIPADAPHPENAHKWLNYLMRPEVMADISNVLKYPNGNKASLPYVQEAIKNDPAIYSDPRTRANFAIETMQPPEVKRLMTRLWTRFRTGQ